MFTETNNERLVEVRAAIKATMESLTEQESVVVADHLVAVPAAFWNDHTSRDLDSASVEVRSTNAYWGDDDGSYVVLVMDDECLAELISDASHYSSSFDEDEFGALMESARRTIVALWEQKPALMADLADSRTDYDNLRWALGINRNDRAIITGVA